MQLKTKSIISCNWLQCSWKGSVDSFYHGINFQFADEMFAKTRTGREQVTRRIPRLIFTLCTSIRISFLLISGEKNTVASAAVAWGRQLALFLGNLSNCFLVLCSSIHFPFYTAAIAKINRKYKANFCRINTTCWNADNLFYCFWERRRCFILTHWIDKKRRWWYSVEIKYK